MGNMIYLIPVADVRHSLHFCNNPERGPILSEHRFLVSCGGSDSELFRPLWTTGCSHRKRSARMAHSSLRLRLSTGQDCRRTLVATLQELQQGRTDLQRHCTFLAFWGHFNWAEGDEGAFHVLCTVPPMEQR